MTVTPRTRSRSGPVKAYNNQINSYFLSGGEWIFSYSNTDPSSFPSTSETMSDVVVDDFFKLQSQGNIFMNPCTKIKEKWEVVSPFGTLYHSSGYTRWDVIAWYDIWAKAHGSFLPFVDKYSDEKEISANQAFASVSSTELYALVTLAELKETKEMLLNAIKRVYRLRRSLVKWSEALRRSRAKTVKQAIVATFDNWMEVRYGWTPLYYEIKALANIIDGFERNISRQTFRGRQSIDDTDDDTIVTYYGSYPVTWTRDIKVEGYASSGVLCEPYLYGKPDTFGVTQLPVVVYELTRLSWALDWFFNIGDTIAAWTPDTYWRPIGSWVTTKLSVSAKASTNLSVFGPYSGAVSPYIVSKTLEYYKRESVAPRTILPHFRFRMKWKHYIDSVALARKRVTRTIAQVYKSMRRR